MQRAGRTRRAHTQGAHAGRTRRAHTQGAGHEAMGTGWTLEGEGEGKGAVQERCVATLAEAAMVARQRRWELTHPSETTSFPSPEQAPSGQSPSSRLRSPRPSAGCCLGGGRRGQRSIVLAELGSRCAAPRRTTAMAATVHHGESLIPLIQLASAVTALAHRTGAPAHRRRSPWPLGQTCRPSMGHSCPPQLAETSASFVKAARAETAAPAAHRHAPPTSTTAPPRSGSSSSGS